MITERRPDACASCGHRWIWRWGDAFPGFYCSRCGGCLRTDLPYRETRPPARSMWSTVGEKMRRRLEIIAMVKETREPRRFRLPSGDRVVVGSLAYLPERSEEVSGTLTVWCRYLCRCGWQGAGSFQHEGSADAFFVCPGCSMRYWKPAASGTFYCIPQRSRA